MAHLHGHFFVHNGSRLQLPLSALPAQGHGSQFDHLDGVPVLDDPQETIHGHVLEDLRAVRRRPEDLQSLNARGAPQSDRLPKRGCPKLPPLLTCL